MEKVEGESKTAETETGRILSMEMVINFQRKTTEMTPENIQGLDTEIVTIYRNTWVLTLTINWTGLTT